MDKFNLEHQYQAYLKHVNLEEKKMIPAQKEQLRFTFMSACAFMLYLFGAEVTILSDDQAVEVLESINKQVQKFFKEATGKWN